MADILIFVSRIFVSSHCLFWARRKPRLFSDLWYTVLFHFSTILPSFIRLKRDTILLSTKNFYNQVWKICCMACTVPQSTAVMKYRWTEGQQAPLHFCYEFHKKTFHIHQKRRGILWKTVSVAIATRDNFIVPFIKTLPNCKKMRKST